ncbi:MAG: FkbM family methyltransferase [Xanthomonadales bacterium]|nr:FkbM family methyltransferase [Xanthomonadales bacterium]
MRALLGVLTHRERETLVRTASGLDYFLPNLLEPVSFSLFADGAFEPETTQWISTLLRHRAARFGETDPIVLDIGANIGCVSLPLLQEHPRLAVHAVEANPAICAYLRRNAAANGFAARLTVHEMCLSDSEAEYRTFFALKEHFGKSSLINPFGAEGVEVRNSSLSRMVVSAGLQDISLIKIDVEGFESHVFQSGVELLRKDSAPDIVFEFCDWAEQLSGVEAGRAQQLLLDLGYSLFLLGDGPWKPLHTARRKGFDMLLASKWYPGNQPRT